jgi:hypothetical protein
VLGELRPWSGEGRLPVHQLPDAPCGCGSPPLTIVISAPAPTPPGAARGRSGSPLRDGGGGPVLGGSAWTATGEDSAFRQVALGKGPMSCPLALPRQQMACPRSSSRTDGGGDHPQRRLRASLAACEALAAQLPLDCPADPSGRDRRACPAAGVVRAGREMWPGRATSAP